MFLLLASAHFGLERYNSLYSIIRCTTISACIVNAPHCASYFYMLPSFTLPIVITKILKPVHRMVRYTLIVDDFFCFSRSLLVWRTVAGSRRSLSLLYDTRHYCTARRYCRRRFASADWSVHDETESDDAERTGELQFKNVSHHSLIIDFTKGQISMRIELRWKDVRFSLYTWRQSAIDASRRYTARMVRDMRNKVRQSRRIHIYHLVGVHLLWHYSVSMGRTFRCDTRWSNQIVSTSC